MQLDATIVDAAADEPFRILAADSPELPPAPQVGPGWRAQQTVVANGFAVLELLHDSGCEAEWYFDGAGRHPNDMAAWPVETQAALQAAFRPSIQALLDAFLFTGNSPLYETLNRFVRLGPAFRATLAALLQPQLLPEPRHHSVDAPHTVTLDWANADALRRSLSVELQDRFVAALRDGALTWPSPTDGTDMPCTGSIALGDFAALFRFRCEPRDGAFGGLDAFVIATEHMSRVAGLYVPAHGVVVTDGSDQARISRDLLPQFAYHLVRHLATCADSLLAGHAQASRPFRFATFLRPGASAHLGHHLWNELTAIDALVAELPHDRLPQWLVAGAPGMGTEFYGSINALFPEIADRVLRGFADQRAIVGYAYENRIILFRATREHVGDRLRRRVMAHAARHAPAVRATGYVLLIGLRVENRTATDLGALCALVIEEAMRRHPGCTIVFDGHNARGDARSDVTISSHREGAALSPLAVERDVVQAMRQRFAGQPVTVLDTLGEPLAVSLAWAQACDGFVALWGAGLAKYRWVANKPGLIVTSRWNLENKGDLHLYDVEAYMADPTPVVFVPADVIHDLPSAPMLVPFEHASYWNFTFEPDAMRAQVRAFLQALDGPPDALRALAVRPARRSGSVDLVDFAVRGWAIRDGDGPVVLDIAVDGDVIGQAICDMPRPDLLAAGFGTATAGFGFVLPEFVLDGTPRTLTVRYEDGVCLPMLSPNTPNLFAFQLGQA